RVPIAGLILNRVASERHEELLRQALGPLGIPVLGALPRREQLAMPSRHLGLVPVPERAKPARMQIEELAAFAERYLDLDAVRRIAAGAPEFFTTPWVPATAVATATAVAGPAQGSPLVAVAGGPAFSFAYAETTELLTAAGAEVGVFDPLRDPALPDGTRALVIGGGFPQLYAAELAGNAALRRQIARRAAEGLPIVAECAGLLYLARSLDGQPMCGVLPTRARMSSRLTLGYREASRADGLKVRAHEFHRTSCSPEAGQPPAYTLSDGCATGFRQGRVQASYLHLHWAGCPAIARELVAAA
ncbi:MAG: cobyrinate a,c-diamide synthase, partial [Mycobacteriales bacterium]